MTEEALIAFNMALRLLALVKDTNGNVTKEQLGDSISDMEASGIRVDNLLKDNSEG